MQMTRNIEVELGEGGVIRLQANFDLEPRDPSVGIFSETISDTALFDPRNGERLDLLMKALTTKQWDIIEDALYREIEGFRS